jgi:hypothetical protein
VSEELEVLKIVTGRLANARIPYMVTGSIAANYYAVPRMTRDIDVVVELTEQDIDRVVELFGHDFYVDPEIVRTAVRGKTLFNMIHSAFVIKVDVVIRKDSEYRRTEFSRRKPASVEGHGFFIVSPEDLILSKLEWAKDTRSEMQLADVRNLVASVRDVDHAYLRQWVHRLGLEAIYREASE